MIKLLSCIILLLSGCAQITETNVYQDNSVVTNYVGNNCSHYRNDKCIVLKNGNNVRNPNNPYK